MFKISLRLKIKPLFFSCYFWLLCKANNSAHLCTNQGISVHMSVFSDRLRVEREKLGLSQEAFGELAGVKKRSQVNYEKGDRQPDSNYLEAISKVGVDVAYLITGVSSQPALPPELAADEQMLVDAYRSLPMTQRKAMLAALLMGDTPKPRANKPAASSRSLKVSGEKNNVRVAGRDYNEN
jgi:transcriptional regulator with XRE-family HTH domain